MIFLLAFACSAFSQTAQGTINAVLINRSGIALVFDSDPSGVALGSTGSSAATLNYGVISAASTLSPGVTRVAVTGTNFTVRTVFDVKVTLAGTTSPNYTLTTRLAAAAPTGISYKLDAVTLTTTSQTITATGSYNTDVPHNLDLVVLTAAPGAGGPATGTALSTTLNFIATAN